MADETKALAFEDAGYDPVSEIATKVMNLPWASHGLTDPRSGMFDHEALGDRHGQVQEIADKVIREMPHKVEPAAWTFELAKDYDRATGEYSRWGKAELWPVKPSVPEGSIRNLTPLYAHPLVEKASLDVERAMARILVLQARELQRLDPQGQTPKDLDVAMIELRAAQDVRRAAAGEPDGTRYQFREIGEGQAWTFCTREVYEHHSNSPHMDTRVLTRRDGLGG